MVKTKKKNIVGKVNIKVGKKVLKMIRGKNVIRVVVLVLLLGAYYQFGSVATVNGRLISRLKYMKSMERQVGEQILDQMITESLILSEAKKKGVEIEAAEIEKEITAIEEQVKAQGRTLEEALAMEGMVRADLEKQIKIQKIGEEMSGSDIEVSQEEIDAFLEEYKDQLPETASEAELQELAEGQLGGQAKNEAMSNWLKTLKEEAKISYR